MTDTVATPEVQATADLSPFSPSPLHSVAPVVLPALQDTADLLDAMTEMPSAQEQAAALAEVSQPPTHHSEGLPTTVAVIDPNDEPNADTDSLDDDYKEEQTELQNRGSHVQPDEMPEGDDDYLKSFDSPPQEVGEPSSAPDDASRAQGPVVHHAGQIAIPHEQPVPNVAVAAATSDAFDAQTAVRTTLPDSQFTPTASLADQAPVAGEPGHSVVTTAHEAEISRLVAEMAGQANGSFQHSQQQPAQPAPDANFTPSSLPPRPPQPQPTPGQPEASYPQQPYTQATQILGPSGPSNGPYTAGNGVGAPAGDFGRPAPPASAAQAANFNATAYPTGPARSHEPETTNDQSDYERLWQLFQEDERRYMAEANWDRFPDGTRIFIGNLSSERVTKRDVFNMFYHYGRLAQISLKSAYGFVQYHQVEEAQGAMQNLQNSEVKGRKIHLEISRAQKKKGGQERARSPDRGRNGREAGQKGGRSDAGHPNRRSRDDFRSGRGSSPRHGREDNYGRDHRYHEHQARGRSRSPPPYGRHQEQPYRRRSPSPGGPYGRGPMTEDRLPIPRRYGSQVPDVQLLLSQDLGPDFVRWVEGAFTARGLKVDAILLNPTLPRDAMVQRQVVEGVHGIVDLDMRAYQTAKIPLRVFDRSAGSNARYDDYQDLEPNVAVELIARAKSLASQAHPPPHVGHPPPQPYGAGAYAPPYGAPHQAAPPPHTYAGNPVQPAGGQPDIERVLSQFGNLDPATLQQLVATVQASNQQQQQLLQPRGGMPPQTAPPLDVNAILGSLSRGAPPAAPSPQSFATPQGYPPPGTPGSRGYPAPPHAGTPGGVPPDSASQVNTIMAQLAKFRQP